MAQSARDGRLDRRSARLRLSTGQRYFKAIGEGLTLVYRRTAAGYGTWSAKIALPGGTYALRALGGADDHQEANGVDVLTFYQAQDKARALDHDAKADSGVIIKPVTVAEAAQEYLTWYRANRRAYRETEHAVRAHILPTLGDTRLDALAAGKIQHWLEQLAAAPARVRTGKYAKKQKHRPPAKTDDEKRARRATANRIFNILRAVLNRAFQRGRVASDAAWRKVRPFGKVDEARIRFLTDAEATRLVNACDIDLRALVRAALLTGARFGELVALRVDDVTVEASGSRVYVARSKSGRPRHIPLNKEGVALFERLTAGRVGDALVFTKKDGTAWGKNHHVRGLAASCKVAKITPPIAFHELRHTYASHLAQAGVDLLTISKLLGHADTRITSKHYAHLADKTLSDAVKKLPSFGNQEARKVRMIAV